MILIGRGLDFDAKSERLIGKRLRKFRSKNAVQLSGCEGKRTSSQFPVMMAKGYHLFPYRTQKLSPSAPMVLGWTRPGRVGRCRNPNREAWMRDLRASLFCGFGEKRRKGRGLIPSAFLSSYHLCPHFLHSYCLPILPEARPQAATLTARSATVSFLTT